MFLDKETQLKTFFKLSSFVTDVFSDGGAKFLDTTLGVFLGNRLLLNALTGSAMKVIRENRRFNSSLFVADLNLGDAVIASCAVAALKDFFPDAEIDFVVKKSAREFIEGNPDVSNLFPLYEGAPFPSNEDIARLSRLIDVKDYDLIINFSPMIDDRILGKEHVVNYASMAASLVRNERLHRGINNISYQAHHFIRCLFGGDELLEDGKNFRGANIYLSDLAIEEAESFISSRGISPELPVLMINPDASAQFTRITFALQRELLIRLSKIPCTILLSSGHVHQQSGENMQSGTLFRKFGSRRNMFGSVSTSRKR